VVEDSDGRSPLASVPWPVRTARLTIRRATLDDAETTWPYRQLDTVGEWISFAPKSLDDYRMMFEDPDRLAKTLIVEKDGSVIGDLMLAVHDAWAQKEVAERARNAQAELGWVLDPRHSGHGYATEAVRGILVVCFDVLNLRRVTANCFADNHASWRLMERLGMRREQHTVRESLHRSGRWLDGYGYALLADEWRQIAGDTEVVRLG
jgi:RimJ/RimL family protein N-acetyltransferase